MQMRRARAPSPQTYIDIQNLYALYNHSSDAGDAETYASCWTEDGALHIEQLGFTVKGRANLIEFKKKDKEGRAGKYRRHWNGSMFLEQIDERTVRGRCYLQGFNGEPGAVPNLADVGVYDDLIVRSDGEWRFASRTISMDGSSWQPPEK